jgi:hypothetical protein
MIASPSPAHEVFILGVGKDQGGYRELIDPHRNRKV